MSKRDLYCQMNVLESAFKRDKKALDVAADHLINMLKPKIQSMMRRHKKDGLHYLYPIVSEPIREATSGDYIIRAKAIAVYFPKSFKMGSTIQFLERDKFDKLGGGGE